MNASIRSWVIPSIAVFALSVAGCEGKPTVVAEDAGAVDSGPPKPVLGGKLGAAVAAAESGQSAPRSSSGAASGPPESGIFGSVAANAALPPNTPVKIELLGEGSDPKFALTPTLKDEQKVVLTVSVRLGPQSALPSVDFALLFKIDKPKEKGDKSKGDSDKAGPVQVIATVTGATPAKEQPGQLPKELSDAIAKLKGSEIRYQLTPEGASVNVTSTLSKDADPALGSGMKALTETVTLMTVPLPQKPLGVGGYWMATDRSTSFGVEVIRYRVFKVEKIEQGRATLALDTRQYATTGSIDLGGASNGPVQFNQFESQGKGEIEWTASALLHPRSQVLQRLMAQMGGPKGAPSRGLQIELSSRSSEPDKPDPKK